MTGDDTFEFVAMAAVADNGVIGVDGEMPWHIPEDMAHVKRETTGHPIIMGRITYESILEAIDKPLPGRTSIVLTSRTFETPENVVLASDLEEAMTRAESAAREIHETDRIFILGGGTVYEQLLPQTDRLMLTEVDATPDGDTYFPSVGDEWVEVSRDEHETFAFVEYVCRSNEE